MPSLVLPNGVLVRLIWTRGGTDHAVNVLGALNTGAIAINQALANSVGLAIKNSFTATVSGSISTLVSLSNVGLRNINVANQAEFLDANAAVAGADATGNLLPPQTSLVVTLRTALAGPSFRGRTYLQGFTENQNDVDSLAAEGTRAACEGFITGVKNALTAAGLELAVLSRPRPAEPLAIPPKLAYAGAVTPVTVITCRNRVWDTQRRRAVPGI